MQRQSTGLLELNMRATLFRYGFMRGQSTVRAVVENLTFYWPTAALNSWSNFLCVVRGDTGTEVRVGLKNKQLSYVRPCL